MNKKRSIEEDPSSCVRRILFLDIETSPAVVQTWQLKKQTIGHDQILDPGRMICFAARWAGEEEMHIHAIWRDGHKEMAKAAYRLLIEADAVVTYNGDRFDLPKLRGEFLMARLPPPPTVTSIDVYRAVKKLGLVSSKLAFVAPLLTRARKLKHEGHGMWTKAMAGDPAAQRRMERYCAKDVLLLEKLHRRLSGYLGDNLDRRHERVICPYCGSPAVTKYGIVQYRTVTSRRYLCDLCNRSHSRRV